LLKVNYYIEYHFYCYFQFSNLTAASIYTISVSAKTITMGTATKLTNTTTKPPIPLLQRPTIIKPPESLSLSYQITLQPITSYETLLRLVQHAILVYF